MSFAVYILADAMKEQPPKIREWFSKYPTEITKLTATIDGALANGAKVSDASEDRVVFLLLVSTRDLFEEILFALNEGFGRSALRSVRTMYECVVFARHLNLHPEKTDDFLKLFHTQWAKILQSMPLDARPEPMHSELLNAVPKYGTGKMIGIRDLDWSGSNTFLMAQEAGALVRLHSSAFDYASAFVHPSAVFLMNTLSVDVSGVTQISNHTQDRESEKAVSMAHDLILNAVDLRYAYAPSPRLKEQLDTCKLDFHRIWGYRPHI
ncbi:DUF5677 domain-containing protein [Tunturiibacter lichenicola]|uniref:DUF5677 domain-containing protein n=1 Tax=Tunturiibacter lichenicola TaxID=2051959 RepID=UPI0021B444AF|nr:DUF5677 domain-containing protein [Edaphobacter lichenicola]